jgi:hypothetical protein
LASSSAARNDYTHSVVATDSSTDIPSDIFGDIDIDQYFTCLLT